MEELSFLASQHEAALRLGAFVFVFAAVALAERAWPRRPLALSKRRRWIANLALLGLDALVLRLLLPAAAVAAAVVANESGFGALNLVPLPSVITFFAALLLLDLAVYLQHLALHAVPVLWRLHRVHHADLDFDITTGTRFHPLEILLSMLVKMVVVALLGAPVVAVVVFEVLLNATAMFNHGNLRLPERVDAWLRLLVVTPDMHRIHHSTHPREMNRNFGFNLPWWDRLFGTYLAEPRAGHSQMDIGLLDEREPERCQTLFGMLVMPFRPRTEAAAPTRAA